MVEKYFNGYVPRADILDKKRKQNLDGFLDDINLCMSNLDFNLALDKIWELINMANKYIEDTKPWILVREKKEEELKIFIFWLIEVLKKVAETISPFMPHTAESIIQQLGKDKVKKGKPLFPRIE